MLHSFTILSHATLYDMYSCPLYDNIRTTLLTRLQQLNLHVPTNHKLLLYDNTRLTPDTNLLIQEHLSAYLIESKRFLHNQQTELNIEMFNFYSFALFAHPMPQSFPIPLKLLPNYIIMSLHILFVILLFHMMYRIAM